MGFFKKKNPEAPEANRNPEIDPYLHAGGHDESNWLVSYADMMTLLCGFFIMLFSIAKIDNEKFEKVRESVSKQFGGDFKSQNAEYARFLHQIIEKNGLAKETSVRFGADGVSLVFQSTTFFDTLSAEISPDGAKTLAPFITEISRIQAAEGKKFKVAVEGHTDSRKILSGPYPSNWELSSARAARVVRAFIEQGFEPNRLLAIGYADTRPVTAEVAATGVKPETTVAVAVKPTVPEPVRSPASLLVDGAVADAPVVDAAVIPDSADMLDRNRRVVIRIFDESTGALADPK